MARQAAPEQRREPLVSVVTIFLDAERFLAEAIESVLAQSYRNWELLLVDDGSRDGSSRIARDYTSRLPDRIRYLEHPGHENRGMSATRNLGLRHATGDYVALLDADDVWCASKLERQLAQLERLPEADMLYGRTLYWHSWQEGGEDEVQGHGIEADRIWEPPALLIRYLSGVAAVPPPCSVLFRRDAARGVGDFEESFRALYEDQAFYAKMCLEYRVFVSNDCLDWYRQHEGSACAATTREEAKQARQRFLGWLSEYLRAQDVENTDLTLALSREAWRCRPEPAWLGQPLPESLVRRARRWALQLEERLPEALRRRIWSDRSP